MLYEIEQLVTRQITHQSKVYVEADTLEDAIKIAKANPHKVVTTESIVKTGNSMRTSERGCEIRNPELANKIRTTRRIIKE